MHRIHLKKSAVCALAITLSLSVASSVMMVSATQESPSAPPSGSTPGDGSGGGPGGNAPGGNAPSGGGGGGADTMTYDYTGTLTGALSANGKEVTSDKETYTASDADENAALVQNEGTLTVTNGTLSKSGDDTNGDRCNFYGLNSILLAVNDGSKAYTSGSTLSADSEGSNGIFSTDGATVYANDDKITTTAGNSRGLDATYGGTIVANQMTISTSGDHSASIATDRGGGSISVTNSNLSTQGSGSPLLYSTGDIEVDNVTGTSTGSQIAGMEGLNTILIYNSSLTSTNTKASASDPIADGIIIYQSTSGDAESATGGAAQFQAVNSTLKSAIASGSMFYFTNTKANIVLSNTTLDFDSSKANLITVQGNDSNNWGTAGSNGATVTFTGLGETISGNIDVDTISSLNLYLLENTTYTGAASISTNSVNTSASDAPIAVNLDGTSKWVVTGNSTVTNLNAAPGALIVDESGKQVTIVANGAVVVKGTSSYTVTVTGCYATTVTTSSDNELSTTYIDRTDFDQYYSTTTSYGKNGTSAATTASEQSTQAAQGTQNTTQESSKSASYVLYGAAAAAVVAGALFVIYKKKKHGDE